MKIFNSVLYYYGLWLRNSDRFGKFFFFFSFSPIQIRRKKNHIELWKLRNEEYIDFISIYHDVISYSRYFFLVISTSKSSHSYTTFIILTFLRHTALLHHGTYVRYKILTQSVASGASRAPVNVPR